MKKRLKCAINTTIEIEVDIPDDIIDEFEISDVFSDWGRGNKNSEIYEILCDEILKNQDDLEWNEIEIYSEENIEE